MQARAVRGQKSPHNTNMLRSSGLAGMNGVITITEGSGKWFAVEARQHFDSSRWICDCKHVSQKLAKKVSSPNGLTACYTRTEPRSIGREWRQDTAYDKERKENLIPWSSDTERSVLSCLHKASLIQSLHPLLLLSQSSPSPHAILWKLEGFICIPISWLTVGYVA